MNLTHLSDDLLEQKLSEYVSRERKLLSLVLYHIKEFDSRRLYLKLGYAHLFEYLTERLKYSNAAAQRRIEAARFLVVAPEMVGKIQDGRLTLSSINEVSRAIKQKQAESKTVVTAEQKRELLTAVENTTVAQAQQILAETLDLELKPVERKIVQKNESVHIQITLSKEQYEKLMACRDLSSHALTQGGDTGLAATIEAVCDQFLRTKTHVAPGPVTSAAEVKSNRSITPKMRRLVLRKFKHCQHIDPQTQRKCKNTFLLQVDHRKPIWAGGRHELENLTLLCASHNRARYNEQSGIQTVSAFTTKRSDSTANTVRPPLWRR